MESCRGDGLDWGLVEADAGDVGLFDEVRIVTLGLVEGKGEVLDAVFGAELHEEVGELSQFGGEPFYIVCRGDSAEQQHVVGEFKGSVRRCEYYERYGKGCIFGGKTGSVGVLLILQLCGRCAVVVAEISLDVGECSFQSGIAYDRYVGGRFCACCSVGSGCSFRR